MKMLTAAVLGFASAATAIALIGAHRLSAQPTFESDLILNASAVFAKDMTGEMKDWRIVNEGDAPRMEDGGITIAAPTTVGEMNLTQYKQEVTPTSGVNVGLQMRLTLDHPKDSSEKAGFYSDTNNPFDTEPDVGAYFEFRPVEGGEDEVDMFIVTKASGETRVVHDPGVVIGKNPTATVDVVFELSGDTSVTYWWRVLGDAEWSSYTPGVSVDLPDGPMLVSGASRRDGGTRIGGLIMRTRQLTIPR